MGRILKHVSSKRLGGVVKRDGLFVVVLKRKAGYPPPPMFLACTDLCRRVWVCLGLVLWTAVFVFVC